MAASVETWQSYGALLARLFPKIQHSVLAGGDGAVLWASDAEAATQLQQTMQIVASSGTNRQSEIDGLLDLHCAPAAHYGFRVRGALGEVLGLPYQGRAEETGRGAGISSPLTLDEHPRGGASSGRRNAGLRLLSSNDRLRSLGEYQRRNRT